MAMFFWRIEFVLHVFVDGYLVVISTKPLSIMTNVEGRGSPMEHFCQVLFDSDN